MFVIWIANKQKIVLLLEKASLLMDSIDDENENKIDANQEVVTFMNTIKV